MSDLIDLLERFRRGAELVAVTMTGAAGPELDFTPEPGKWSIRQIVSHLADSEIVATTRLRRILAEDNPALEPYDQNAWAANLDYNKRKTSQALETFRRMRGENYELLKELPETAFNRVGMHKKLGEVTLLRMVQLFAEHAENHAQQLRTRRNEYKLHRAATSGGDVKS
jgi:hypothetical protein